MEDKAMPPKTDGDPAAADGQPAFQPEPEPADEGIRSKRNAAMKRGQEEEDNFWGEANMPCTC